MISLLVVMMTIFVKSMLYSALLFFVYIILVSFEKKIRMKAVGKMGHYQSKGRDLISLLQDMIKIFFKEGISYKRSSAFILGLSPAVALGISILPIIVIPICEPFLFNGQKIFIEVMFSKNSLLLFMCLNSLNIFSILIIGWGINSNFSILSNLKKSMHYVALEITLLLIIINMIFTFETVDLHSIVLMQKKDFSNGLSQLGIFIQPILSGVFLFYIIVSTSFLNYKISFELQGSQHGVSTCLNSIGLIFLKVSDHVKFFINCLVFVFLFLGGYGLLPGLSFFVESYSDSLYYFQIISLIIKTIFVGFLAILLKQNSANLRADQVLKHTWNKIIPLLYINSFGTILFILFSGRYKWI